MRIKLLAAALAGAGLVAALPAQAVTEIQWWHSMTGANDARVNDIANKFNATQSDFKVVPVYKGGYADSMAAAIAAFRGKNPPDIVQIFEVGTATMMAAKGAIKPVYQIMHEAGEKFDPKSYMPAVTVQTGTPRSIFDHPASADVAHLLGRFGLLEALLVDDARFPMLQVRLGFRAGEKTLDHCLKRLRTCFTESGPRCWRRGQDWSP